MATSEQVATFNKGAAQGKISFLASYPKSGNTYIRLLIQAFLDGEVNINHIDVVLGDTGRSLIQSLLPSDSHKWPAGVAATLRPAIVANMVYLTTYSRTRIWKTHWANSLFFGVTSFPPFLVDRVCYLVRDPRNVVVSLAKHYGVEIPVAMEAMMTHGFVVDSSNDYMQTFTSSWAHNVESHLKSQTYPVLAIRYEDLVADPVFTFTQVVKFFDLKGKVSIDKAVELCDIARIRKLEEEEGFIERQKQDRFFTEPSPNKWEGVLSDEQARALINSVRKLPKDIQEFLDYG